MAESIVINADAFFDRLTHLYNSWKSDKRAGDGVFGGADSIVVLAGKAEQESSTQKHNALHVSPTRSWKAASHRLLRRHLQQC